MSFNDCRNSAVAAAFCSCCGFLQLLRALMAPIDIRRRALAIAWSSFEPSFAASSACAFASWLFASS
eukprot:11836579-Prorocentrum_lima.AAC.1